MIINFSIPLDPRTKKNSQRMVKRGNRYIPLPSEAFEQYQKDAGLFIRGRGMNLQIPLEIRCEFYMKTRRRVDLVNLIEAIDDILVHYGVIADDNSNIVVSHDGSRVHWDKDNPRTEITILSLEENNNA